MAMADEVTSLINLSLSESLALNADYWQYTCICDR